MSTLSAQDTLFKKEVVGHGRGSASLVPQFAEEDSDRIYPFVLLPFPISLERPSLQTIVLDGHAEVNKLDLVRFRSLGF